jgi:hypothetical protein
MFYCSLRRGKWSSDQGEARATKTYLLLVLFELSPCLLKLGTHDENNLIDTNLSNEWCRNSDG